MCCAVHAEALLPFTQGDLAQPPRWSPGSTALVLHHVERFNMTGIWRAEKAVHVGVGATVSAACMHAAQQYVGHVLLSFLIYPSGFNAACSWER